MHAALRAFVPQDICVDELRKSGVKKACPLCRAKLPPDPEMLLQEACARCMVLVRSRASRETWQHEMVKMVRLLREAADQGHAKSQFNLGCMHEKGEGVEQSIVEAVRWTRMAAD